ncbi:MAG: SDR family oxidoreductase [Phycisphaerae bacterium]
MASDAHPACRIALVTGASRRVGRAIALELAGAGCDVAVHYHRSEAPAAAVRAEIEAHGRRAVVVRADLEEPDAVDRLIADVVAGLGGVDILVNNASSFERMALDETDAGRWRRTLAVNTVAPALLARAVAAVMRRRGGGHIINLIDTLADRAVKGYMAYIASKAALSAVTRCLALELAPQITVNGIAPGIAEFPEDYDQATREKLIAKVPLRRAGSPADIARLVRFLATEGGYITGAIIPVDGGRSIRP